MSNFSYLDQKLYLTYVMNLSDEDKRKFEESEVGDTFSIEAGINSMMVGLFRDDEEICLLAFSDMDEVPVKFKKDEHAFMLCSLNLIVMEMDAVNKVLHQTPILIVNPFSENAEEFSLDEIEEYIYRKS